MKRNFSRDQCTGCGNCLRSCPQKILKITDKRNAKNLPYVVIDGGTCVGCGRCAVMCTAGATWMAPEEQDHFDTLLALDKIPPHGGCSLGILGRLLAEVIAELGLEERVAIFGGSDVNLNCESYILPTPQCFDEALAYKREHPERVVVSIYPDSKRPAHEAAIERFLKPHSENITVLHTLNYFTQEDDYQRQGPGAENLLEQVHSQNYAGFLARGGVKTPEQVKALKGYIRTALKRQVDEQPFSMVEMIFPCYYRLEGRPQEPIPYERIDFIKEWFAKQVEPAFPVGIIKE